MKKSSRIALMAVAVYTSEALVYIMRLHGAISQKAVIFILTIVGT
jgi:hypothetical protein